MENIGLFSSLPWFLRVPLEFILFIIIIRGVIANDITSWLKEKGLIKESKQSYTWKVLDFLYNAIISTKKYIRDKILSTQRKEILWQHIAEGHDKPLQICSKDGCQNLT